MKRILSIAAGTLALTAGAAYGAPGDLDTTFSADGKLLFNVANSGRADSLALDSKGRLVVSGNVDPPSGGDTGDFAVARFLPNGDPDTSFSGDGFLNLDPGGDDDQDDANALVIDSAGRILVGGSDSGAAQDFAIIRLVEDGTLDSSFGGGDGKVVQDFAGGADTLNAMTLDSSGRVVAAGIRSTNFVVARFSTAGDLDLSFGGGDGFEALDVNNAPGNSDVGTDVAIDSTGRIVMGGYTALAIGSENFAIARFSSSGILDESFSNDIPTPGRIIALMSSEVPGEESDVASELAIAPGDRPILTGFAEIAGNQEDVAVLKVDAAGQPDAAFSGDGQAYMNFGGSDRGNALALDPSGRLVIAGRSIPATGAAVVGLGRMLADGTPDPTFSVDGQTTSHVGPLDDFGDAVAIDTAGRIVIAGYNGPFGTGEWILARFEGAPRCGGKVPTVVGTTAKDKLKGTKGKDVISGGTGKDKISGLGGADVLCGEDGKDTLLGGGGKDRLLGGKGKDLLKGGKGKDKLKGGKGKDKQIQ